MSEDSSKLLITGKQSPLGMMRFTLADLARPRAGEAVIRLLPGQSLGALVMWPPLRRLVSHLLNDFDSKIVEIIWNSDVVFDVCFKTELVTSSDILEHIAKFLNEELRSIKVTWKWDQEPAIVTR